MTILQNRIFPSISLIPVSVLLYVNLQDGLRSLQPTGAIYLVSKRSCGIGFYKRKESSAQTPAPRALALDDGMAIFLGSRITSK